MADALTFQIALIDKMSGPARAMAKAMGELDASMKKVRAKSAEADKTQRVAKEPPGLKSAEDAGRVVEDSKRLGKELVPTLKLTGKELDALKQKLRDDKLAVTNLSASLRQMQQASSVDIQAVKLLRAQIQQKKDALASTQRQLVLSGNAAKLGSEGTNRLTTTLRELAEAAGAGGLTGLPGALTRVRQTASFVKTPLGAAALAVGALAAAAIAGTAALLGFAAAVVGVTVAGSRLAARATETKKDTLITLEAMLGTAEAAKNTYANISRITNEVDITQERAIELAETLSTAGLKSQGILADSIRAIGQAESVVKGAGSKLEGLVTRAQTPIQYLTPFGVQMRRVFRVQPSDFQGTGVAIQDFYAELGKNMKMGNAEVRFQMAMGRVTAEEGTKALNAVVSRKFGSAAESKMLLLSKQMRRFRDNVTKLFEDVRTDGLLKGLKGILEVFDQSTVAGNALKGIITETFSGLFRTLERLAPYVKIFFKGMVILALRVYIAFKPLLERLGMIGTTGEDSQNALIDRMSRFAEKVGKAAEVLATMLDILIKMAKIELKVLDFGSGVATGGSGRELGEQLGTGIRKGLDSRVPEVLKGIGDLGGKAIAKFKEVFKISSPSKVTFGMGANVGAGVALGIRSKQRDAEDSMARIVRLSDFRRPERIVPAQPTRSAERDRVTQTVSTRGGDYHVTIAPGAIQISGISNAEQLRELFPEMFADAFERLAQSRGADDTEAA